MDELMLQDIDTLADVLPLFNCESDSELEYVRCDRLSVWDDEIVDVEDIEVVFVRVEGATETTDGSVNSHDETNNHDETTEREMG